MLGRLADRDVDSVSYAFVARARPARAGRAGLAVQSPGRPRWRRPGHGHRPQHIRDPRRLKHARVRRNLGYSKITTSRPSSPTAGGPFPGILPLSVILGSRIASTKGGLRSGVTHVTVCANEGRASAAAAADRMIFRNAHQCVAHDSSVTPSSLANYSTRNARAGPGEHTCRSAGSMHLPGADHRAGQRQRPRHHRPARPRPAGTVAEHAGALPPQEHRGGTGAQRLRRRGRRVSRTDGIRLGSSACTPASATPSCTCTPAGRCAA